MGITNVYFCLVEAEAGDDAQRTGSIGFTRNRRLAGGRRAEPAGILKRMAHLASGRGLVPLQRFAWSWEPSELVMERQRNMQVLVAGDGNRDDYTFYTPIERLRVLLTQAPPQERIECRSLLQSIPALVPVILRRVNTFLVA